MSIAQYTHMYAHGKQLGKSKNNVHLTLGTVYVTGFFSLYNLYNERSLRFNKTHLESENLENNSIIRCQTGSFIRLQALYLSPQTRTHTHRHKVFKVSTELEKNNKKKT